MTQKEFNKRYNITKEHLTGEAEYGGYLNVRGCDLKGITLPTTIGGSLDVSGCDLKGITLPTTIGGSLDVRGCDLKGITLPTTIGGYLYDDNGSTYIGAKVPNAYFYTDNKYATIDGIFCEILSKRSKTINGESCTIYTGRKIGKSDTFIIANVGDYYAHGATVRQAITDLQFKIMSEKLKKEPIEPDTMFTVMYYRTLTGACDLGCRDFMERNKIPYKVEDDKTIEVAPISAKDLLPILENSNAYGVDKFRSLINWA